MPRKKKSLKRARAGDSNRQRIVEAARTHFFSHGFRRVTMDDLAAELAISKKTLYAYFPSKTALLEDVLADNSPALVRPWNKWPANMRTTFPAHCISYSPQLNSS